MVVGAVAAGLLGTAGTASAQPSTVRVADADIPFCPTLGASQFCKEEVGSGRAAVVTEGANSYLRLSTPTSTAKATVHNVALAGKSLRDILKLEYRTLIETPSGVAAPSLNIAINPGEGTNNDDGKPQTFATLVWEPTYTGVNPTPGAWQTWRPTATASGAGGWWATRAGCPAVPAGQTPACPEDPTTGVANKFGFKSYTANFAEVLDNLPYAKIISVQFNQGSGPAGLIAGADNLVVNDTTYDFDNPVLPTKLDIVSGNNQSAVALAPFAQPLTTRAFGRDGSVPAPGAPVTYTVTGPATFPGNVKTVTVSTGPDGTAVAPALTAGLAPGPVTVVTSTPGAPSVTFNLTVTPPPGPAVADLVLTVADVPPTIDRGGTFTATVTVRNNSSFPATQVRTSLTAPSGLKITSAPGGLVTPAAVLFTAPTLAPDATVTYKVTFTVDRNAVRGAKTIPVATNSSVRDPNPLNNSALVPVTVR